MRIAAYSLSGSWHGERQVTHETLRATLPRTLPVAALLWSAAAPAGHPLITEDTGTQGAGRWQLELTLDHGRSSSGVIRERSYSSSAVISYGVRETADLILTVPYERTEANGGGSSDSARGLGDVEIAAKWRFFEHGQTSLAVRPGISLPTGDDDEGLGTGRAAPSLFAVLSHEPGAWGFHVHVGYTNNRNDVGERRDIYHGSLAATYRSSPQWLWVADVSTETDPDPAADEHVRSAVLGTIWTVRPNLDLDLGYRKGLSDSADDHTWLFGLAYRF